MYFSLVDFFMTFPNYEELNKTPMRSSWKEKDGKTILSVVVPGYEKEDFKLFFEDNSLKLNIKNDKIQGGLTYSILEEFYTAQHDIEAASADYHSGILTVTIPKADKKKAKQFSIKVS